MLRLATSTRDGLMSPLDKQVSLLAGGISPPYPFGTRLVTTDYTVTAQDKGKCLIVRVPYPGSPWSSLLTITIPPAMASSADFTVGIHRDDGGVGRCLITTGTSDLIDGLASSLPVFNEHFDVYGDGTQVATTMRQKGWVNAGVYDTTSPITVNTYTFPQALTGNLSPGMVTKYRLNLNHAASGSTKTVSFGASANDNTNSSYAQYGTSGTTVVNLNSSGSLALSGATSTGEQFGFIEADFNSIKAELWNQIEIVDLSGRTRATALTALSCFFNPVPTRASFQLLAHRS